jgi:WD40 repeat protein
VAFHPNNTTVIAGGADKLTQVHTLSVTRLIPAAAAPIRGLALTPNATHALTASDDKTVKLWNLASGANERTFAGAEKAVNCVTVSKNNTLVATGGEENLVRVYNFADAKLLSQFKAPGPVRGLSFSPNNLTLAAACLDKSLVTWNVAYTAGQPLTADFGKVIQTATLGAGVTDVVFAPDNVTYYSSSLDKTVKAWKFASDNPTKSLAHPNYVDAVAFNKEGTLLATGSHVGTVHIWDVAKGTQLRQIAAHATPAPSPVYCLAWSPDSKQVASGSLDHSLKLWDANAGTLVREFKGYKEKEAEKGHRDGVFCVAFTPDGKSLVSGSSDRSIKVWNVADGNVIREFANPNIKPGALPNSPVQAHPGWVYSLRLTPDGKHLVSVGNAPKNQGYLAVWDMNDGKMLYGQELPLGPFHSLSISPDGKSIGLACGPQGRQFQNVNSYVFKMPVPGK